MVELGLTAIFLGSGAYAGFLVWRKIPLLLQVPQQLIEESFVTRPSRVKKYVEPVTAFFRGRRYQDAYYAVLVWCLHRLRLWLLRFERLIYRMLESLQEREMKLSATEERYWGELKQWKQDARASGNTLPKEVLKSAPPPAVNGKQFPNTKPPA